MPTSTTERFEGFDSQPTALPANLGRYRISKELGRGGFGRVFLAYDELLKRTVAVKLLHLRSSAAVVPSLLAEARTIAQMNHPGILPIFDAMETDEGQFCIVSPYVEGETLRQQMLGKQFSHLDAAEMVVRVCDALHHAHKRGVVHRDVKPANIMITPDGFPVLLDFGLAKSLQDVVKDRIVAGTPGYMSPEQARGEDHLVNGRSDIYSLGSVFYEMLTARRAFPVTSFEEQLRRLAAGEPIPPRDALPAVPKELSRICMKALNPQMRWRYPVAVDMAEDLQAWIATRSATIAETREPATPKLGTAATARSEEIRVVPRGLRAFDEGDADFFLKLVPGPRDQYGLPEGLRFWKQRIESTDARMAFRVGVIYGPSGCGKSSLVSAGLLPRCATQVNVIFHEARHAGNAARLAKVLHAKFPALDLADPYLPSLLHQLRTSGMLAPPQKLLLVIDQTEQWLRACETSESEEGSALLNTVRQCDGLHVQALLLVRDDFWRGVSRLLTEADVEIMSSNSALVDLFDPRHAEMVLESFGRAYRCLPEEPSVPLAPESQAFIRRAINHLSEGGKISPVRLALFTEIFRARPWTLDSLKQVGGVSGVAVAFLDDVFRGPSVGGPRRIHEPAARRIFELLVPATGDVRGPAARQSALVEASGYAAKPGAFQELLNLLDTELRLLTPVDPDDADVQPAWQLTHDYMVPALRHWLLAEKATTRRGRAEIALAERAREWRQRPDRTRLPGLWEWSRLRAITDRRKWSPPEQDWMHAGMKRVRRAALYCTLIALVTTWALGEWRNSVRARDFAQQILMASPDEVAGILKSGDGWSTRTRSILEQALSQPASTPAGLNARLALVTANRGHAETLAAAMLDADARTFAAIRSALAVIPHLPLNIFRDALDDPSVANSRKLRAVAALAAFQSDDPRTAQVATDAGHWLLTSVNDISFWAVQLQPLAPELSPVLEKQLVAGGADTPSSAIALANLQAGNPPELVRLLGLFPPAEVPLLVRALRKHQNAQSLLAAAVKAIQLPPASDKFLSEAEEVPYIAESNLLLASLSLGFEEDFWARLTRDTDRTLRSSLILNAAAAGVPAEVFTRRLPGEKDAGRRQAILAILSGYPISALPAPLRDPLFAWLRQAFLADSDAGVHSMVMTLMQRWSLDGDLATLQANVPATPSARRQVDWWMTPAGTDMRIVTLKNGNRVAIGVCEVTLAEYRRFRQEPKYFKGDTNPEPGAPVTGLSWVNAARYCNWLNTEEGLGPESDCYVETDGKWMSYPDALSRRGYRLPTKAEWLASASSARNDRWDFGRSLSHITSYGWTAVNAGDQPHRVASLLPNEQGLWDTFGNASEWIHEWRGDFGSNHLGEVMGADYTTFRVKLAVIASPFTVESPRDNAGFRVARTLDPATGP